MNLEYVSRIPSPFCAMIDASAANTASGATIIT